MIEHARSLADPMRRPRMDHGSPLGVLVEHRVHASQAFGSLLRGLSLVEDYDTGPGGEKISDVVLPAALVADVTMDVTFGSATLAVSNM